MMISASLTRKEQGIQTAENAIRARRDARLAREKEAATKSKFLSLELVPIICRRISPENV